ncbi:MAG: outer membrane lipoprotein carrier protein LolA [Acidobacteriia bacterium]|nr:outer membrane lipoprotein carrier protein LolA [Terriglobia bacterium]
MTISVPRRAAEAAGIALLLACGSALGAPERKEPSATGGGVEGPALQEVLAGFDRVQGTIRTLSAQFVETTASQLLKDPIQAKGRFFLTKPSSVLWEYAEPEVMRFSIANDQYVGYFPQRKRAERSDVHRWSERIFRIFGLGQTSAELGKFYSVRAAEPGPDDPGTRLLVLEPKKRRVRKHIEQVRLWVSASTYLPVKIELGGKDGYVRVIQFHDVQVNPVLAASLYTIEIPAGVTVTNGTSGLETVRPQGPTRPR